MDSQQNIVITGFMGTGKSTVGRLLAKQLGRRYVDMDALLAERFGKPVAIVFAEEGEEAFRTAEAELCKELAAEQRVAGVLVGVQGWPVGEAARLLEVPEGTVKSRCARGRTKLAALVGRLREERL